MAAHTEDGYGPELDRTEAHSEVVHTEVADIVDEVADHKVTAAVGHSLVESDALLAGYRFDFRNCFGAMKLPWNLADGISLSLWMAEPFASNEKDENIAIALCHSFIAYLIFHYIR